MADKFVLLVEGKNDLHVLSSLLMRHQVPDAFKIKNKDGIENLLQTLDVELLASDLRRLGIVVDADDDPSARWSALRNILVNSGYSVPTVPETAGSVLVQSGLPTVGVWMMPNNDVAGMLEDFIGFLVPPDDALWNQADACLQQVMSLDRRFPTVHESKARLHTWLAWQEEPGTPMGQAITKRYFDADAPHALELIAWIRRLFNLT